MDTSVSSGYGRVNNIGLMNDKQNYVIVSVGAVFLGFFMIVMDKTNTLPVQRKIRNISAVGHPERPKNIEEMAGYIEGLGIYEVNGCFYFEKGKTKSLDTALMWAEAAKSRKQEL